MRYKEILAPKVDDIIEKVVKLINSQMYSLGELEILERDMPYYRQYILEEVIKQLGRQV